MDENIFCCIWNDTDFRWSILSDSMNNHEYPWMWLTVPTDANHLSEYLM